MKRKLFNFQVAEGIYLISKEDKNDCSMEFGKATANSYLVVGENKALLFDLAVNDKGLWDYAKTITDKELILVLSHAHVDHVYHLNKRKEVFIHKADEEILKKGMLGMLPVKPCPKINYLYDNDTIDLGSRVLMVIHIPGHTKGSILLYDSKTKTLLSGDTVARRILLGISGEVDIPAFCSHLNKLNDLDIEKIYSAHDRAPLPKEYINFIKEKLLVDFPKSTETWSFPGLPKMANLHYGDEKTVDFIDIAAPKQK